MTRSSTPAIAVLMSVRNNAADVGVAIASLRAQTFSDFECVVVDDGSTDASAEAVERATAGDSRFRLVRQENRGLGPSLNRAAEMSTAPLIARQDADDESFAERLALQFERFDGSPSLGLLGTWSEFVEEPWGYTRWFIPPDSHGDLRRLLLLPMNPFTHGSVMMRRDAFVRAGGYRLRGNSQDYELWLRMMDHCGLGNVQRVLYRYNVRSDSISFRVQERRRRIVGAALERYRDLSAGRNVSGTINDVEAEIGRQVGVSLPRDAQQVHEYSTAIRCLVYGEYGRARAHFSSAARTGGPKASRLAVLGRVSWLYCILRAYLLLRMRAGGGRYYTALNPGP